MLLSICNNCKYGSYRYGRILGDDICWVLCLYVSYEETKMAGGAFIFWQVEQPGLSSKFTNKKIGRISTGGSTGYTTYITKIPRQKLMIYLNR